jgi:hypothetical protein
MSKMCIGTGDTYKSDGSIEACCSGYCLQLEGANTGRCRVATQQRNISDLLTKKPV